MARFAVLLRVRTVVTAWTFVLVIVASANRVIPETTVIRVSACAGYVYFKVVARMLN